MLSATAIETGEWIWRGLSVRYQRSGDSGPPILCIHGFGVSSDHWRKNLPELGQTYRVYAIDLIGFGGSAKPKPGLSVTYTFATWSQQVQDFCQEVIGEPTFIAANSIGCVVAMQAAVDASAWVVGIVSIDCSLRLLHERNRHLIPWHQRLSAPLLQQMLGIRPFGHFFFSRIAKAGVVRNLLKQAYGHPEAVTDDLVDLILQPALDAGAADVFLAFVRYSQGPLPRDLLPQLSCPVLMIWGEADPWEPIEMGRELANYSAVADFIALPGVGHCPQDEAPDQVNALIHDWIQRVSPSPRLS